MNNQIRAINAEQARCQELADQHLADNKVVTILDNDDMELQLAKLEAFAGQAGQAHLARRLDEAVALAAEAIDLMTRFHSHAEPDDTPDMNAVFSAMHFTNFVNDHARLMFKLAAFKRNPVDPAFLRLKKAADEVCTALGALGTIDADDDRVSKLMDSLYETDPITSVFAESDEEQPT